MEVQIGMGLVIFWLWWRINILQGRIEAMEKIINRLFPPPSPAENLQRILQEHIKKNP